MNFTALVLVLIFLSFDVLTGWLKALSTKTANSTIMRKGLFHKVAEILAVGFGYLCEYTFPLTGVDLSIPLAGGIATYIVVMETASIVENLCVLNPSLNAVLGKFFAKEELQQLDERRGKHEVEKSSCR